MSHTHALLIESHPLLRQILRQLLTEAGLDVMAEAEAAVEGMRLAVRLRPDFVIVDSTMTDVNGLVLSQLLHEVVPGSRVILLVNDSTTYCPVVEQSVAACIGKQTAAHELPLVIQRLLGSRGTQP